MLIDDITLSHSDNHNHIILASLDSMVKAAKNVDVSHLSVTEHVSQFHSIKHKVKFVSVHESGRMFSNFDEYLEEFSNTQVSSGIEIRKGLEVDYLEDYERVLGEEVSSQKWDFLLCSIHELPNGIDVEAKGLPQDKESVRKRWKEYFLTQKQALQSDFIPFNVLAHPTRLGVSMPIFPEDIDEMIMDLAKLASKKGKALELNGKDMNTMPVLVRKVAQACHVTNCKVSFGSDAHFPNQVSRNFDQASELVKELKLQFLR
jgi:HisJ family histidinol phosphate phosphatase